MPDSWTSRFAAIAPSGGPRQRFFRVPLLEWMLRSFVTLVVVLTVTTVTVAAIGQSAVAPDLRIRGADISFTLQEEAIGWQLRDIDGEPAPIEQILAAHGANYIRLRVWVDPVPGTSDLESALLLARRAEAADLQLLLDLHYSDTWADRTSQRSPAAWEGQNPEELRETVRTYTRDVVAAFAGQGTPVDIIQIGNEVSCGMLWPEGALCGPVAANWDGFAALLKAGAQGAREGHAQAPPAVMVHIDTGGDFESSAHVLDNLVQRQVGFDYIGLSYYPFWHGPLSSLRHNLAALAHRYGKDIIVAETAYPWTLSYTEPTVLETADALPQAAEYPPTPEGQAAYFTALNRLLREVPDGHGAGYFVWEPGWLPGVPAAPGIGNTHANLTLFEWNGQGLPALDAFRPTGRGEE